MERTNQAASCEARPTAPAEGKPSAHYDVDVLWVRHWTESLFSFAVTRPPAFRFRSGEFVMVGMPSHVIGENKPILRAYSIASPSWSDELEIFSIKVANGPLTSRLQNIKVGDRLLLGKKPTGTLVLDALKPGKRLFLFASGTGLAPFLSLIRDPDVYERFEKVVLVHGVRRIQDLAYREFLTTGVREDPLLSEMIGDRLVYYPTVTREPFEREGRITHRINNGAFFADLGMASKKFDPAEDRGMVCGSMAMIKDIAELLERDGLHEGANSAQGEYVIERAFVG
jgi:ferredoxin--NADP+ reductase